MAESYNGVPVPRDGGRIAYKDQRIKVPDNPIIPFIEGDGTGRDIWKASVRVFDGAVQRAYNGKRRVVWYEIFAERKPKQNSTTGFLRILSTRFANFALRLKVRSQPPSVAAFDR